MRPKRFTTGWPRGQTKEAAADVRRAAQVPPERMAAARIALIATASAALICDSPTAERLMLDRIDCILPDLAMIDPADSAYGVVRAAEAAVIAGDLACLRRAVTWYWVDRSDDGLRKLALTDLLPAAVV